MISFIWFIFPERSPIGNRLSRVASYDSIGGRQNPQERRANREHARYPGCFSAVDETAQRPPRAGASARSHRNDLVRQHDCRTVLARSWFALIWPGEAAGIDQRS